MYPIDNCLQISASQETIPSFIITKDLGYDEAIRIFD